MVIPICPNVCAKSRRTQEPGALVFSLLNTSQRDQSSRTFDRNGENDDVRNIALNVLRKTPVELSLNDAKQRISIATTLGKLDKL
ncbi:hypothetical protein [Leptospira borgpetersenii]|uniref:Uncharacterized protein n=1 Tax=Leptospira borgpetersenii serovar Ballum TaxID=280505 RepID=A0A0S2ISC0_LEPBO|nr:hypothetical protein [Leptospira borgpetersenii]ALO26564.1 hypothetical protein LBBP_02315 [Leptospira borgpetersenii serovar Ballum]